jgi:pimeloyl-ACP methyl ester carboxylesterase
MEGRRSFPQLPDSVLAQAPGLRFLANGGCRAWDVPKAPETARDPAKGSIPTLVLGGSFDALTGEQWAGYVAGQLDNATLVEVPAAGHGALFRNPCPQQVFVSFLSNPNAPDTGCIPEMAPAFSFEFTIEE